MESRQKIIYLITKGFWGGAQRYVFDLATGLPVEQFEVLVALGEPGALGAKLEQAGIRTMTIPHLNRDVKIWSDFKTLFALLKILKTEQPDIIHLNSSKVGGIGALAVRIHNLKAISYLPDDQAGKLKAIFTAHGWAFNEERPRWQKKIIAFFHWLTIILCHQTIAVSQVTLNQAKNWPLVNNKLKLIYNGLTEPVFYSRLEARKKLMPDLSPDTVWLGTIAELHRNKGLDILIEAFARLAPDYSNLNLLIIGEGEEREHLAMQIARHHLINRIHLLGQVPEGARYLKAFDIFTLPSRTEALPYAVLEAGLAGLPVVASRVGGIPEIIKNGETGLLVPPADPAALAGALKTLLPERYRESTLGRHLKTSVQQNFSRSQMLAQTLALYR
jgi:glycosyltransferase involved in cell wall biosynthesis